MGTLKYSMLFIVALGASTIRVEAQEDNANDLLVEAAVLYQRAQSADPVAQEKLLKQVRSILDEIVEIAPDSPQGQAIMSGEDVAGIDSSKLPQKNVESVPSYNSMTGLLDIDDVEGMAEYTKQLFPTSIEAIDRYLSLDGVEKKASITGAYYLAVLASYMDETVDHAFMGLFTTDSYKDLVVQYIESGPEAVGVNFAVDVASNLAKEYAVDFAASVLTDIVLTQKPRDISPNLENILRVALQATFVETFDALEIYLTRDPWSLAEKFVGRTIDIYKILNGSSALAATQDQGLLITSISLETLAALVTEYPTQRSRDVARSSLQLMHETIPDIVGSDDTEVVSGIFNVGYLSLIATFEGDINRANLLKDKILADGRRSNIGPFALFTNPQDWIVAAANWGQDAPSRAASILVGSTSLSKLKTPAPDSVTEVKPQETANRTHGSRSPDGAAIVVSKDDSTTAIRLDPREKAYIHDVDLSKPAPEVIPSDAMSGELLGSDEVQEFIQSALPSSIWLKSARYKIFPSSESSGRISISGYLVLSERVVQATPAPNSAPLDHMRTEVIRLGYLRQQFDEAIVKLGFWAGGVFRNSDPSIRPNPLTEYMLTQERGVVIVFDAELSYIQTVNGSKITGKLNYRLPDGRMLSSVREPHLIVGTEAYYERMSEVLKKIEETSKSVHSVKRRMDDMLSSGFALDSLNFGNVVSRGVVGVRISGGAAPVSSNGWNAEPFAQTMVKLFGYKKTLNAEFVFNAAMNRRGVRYPVGTRLPASVSVFIREDYPSIESVRITLSVKFRDGEGWTSLPVFYWNDGKFRSQNFAIN